MKDAGYSYDVLKQKGNEYCPGGMNDPPKLKRQCANLAIILSPEYLLISIMSFPLLTYRNFMDSSYPG